MSRERRQMVRILDTVRPDNLADLVERACQASSKVNGRTIIGIAGAPGAGKPTIAAELVGALGQSAALVPMDGFHLDNETLIRRDLLSRRGAPDTFDIDGYLDALDAIRATREQVWIPDFDRATDTTTPCAHVIPIDVPIVITSTVTSHTEKTPVQHVNGSNDPTRPTLIS